MAGMFYSLQEVAKKLNMSEEQIKEFVNQRKLREFQQEGQFFYKVDEVDALMADTGLISAELTTDETQDLPAASSGDESRGGMEESPLPIAPVEQQPEEIPLEAESEPAEPEVIALEDDIAISDQQPSDTKDEEESDKTEFSISLDAEEGSTKGVELSEEDTAITHEGLNVLDQTDQDFMLTDDTRAETKAVEEASTLEDIEGDVNLDSFGSGSGLLDLSLQADDTSLGGILDEIYTPEGEGEVPAQATAADVAAEAEQIMADETVSAGTITHGYIEPEPDLSSNIYGLLILLPLVAVFYTLIVTMAGQFGILGTLVPKGRTIIYIILAVGFGLGAAVGLYGWMAGAPAKPKKPKVKKQKAPKPKKEPKAKKVKPKKEKKKKK